MDTDGILADIGCSLGIDCNRSRDIADLGMMLPGTVDFDIGCNMDDVGVLGTDTFDVRTAASGVLAVVVGAVGFDGLGSD